MGGKEKPLGIVCFGNVAHAEAAIAETEVHVIGGRVVDVAAHTESKKRSSKETPAAAPQEKKLRGKGENASKVFVVGFSKSKTTKALLEQYFQHYGRVLSVHMPVSESGKSKGHAFVTFAEGASARNALGEVEPHVLEGKSLQVLQPKERSFQVFVGGLPKETTSGELSAYFAQFGRICDSKKVEDRRFGFVSFEDVSGFKRALQKTTHQIGGKPLEVRKALKNAPKDSERIHIMGVAETTTEKSLKKYFSYYGDVLDAQVRKGFARVVFADAVSGELAVTEVIPHVLDGKTLRVKVYEKDPPVRLHIGGLGPGATADTLGEYLSYYGDVREIDVKMDVGTGTCKGYGFAVFVDPVSTELALGEVVEHVLDGKTIKIKKAMPGKPVKLFVGGLAPQTTIESLKAYLSYYGKVGTVDIKRDEAGKSRCFGFVEIARAPVATAILAEAEHVVDGKIVAIQTSNRRAGRERKAKQVFIGGLSPATTAESLYEYLLYYGDLEEVDVKEDPATGTCRGIAFATFVDPISGELAVEEPEHVIDGKSVRIEIKDNNRKGKSKGEKA